jgi:hypothetical protein
VARGGGRLSESLAEQGGEKPDGRLRQTQGERKKVNDARPARPAAINQPPAPAETRPRVVAEGRAR